MPRIVLAIGAAGLLAGCATSAATGGSSNQEGEARLARMIEGRVAGEPTRCINAGPSNRVEVIEGIGIVYDGGDTLYVARASDPTALRRSDAPVIQRASSGRLCTDEVRFGVDRNQGNVTTPIFLSDFVPYRRR